MSLLPDPRPVKIATASAAAETFSVIIRLTSLRAEEPPAAIFITLRAITRCASIPSNAPSAAANQKRGICQDRSANCSAPQWWTSIAHRPPATASRWASTQGAKAGSAGGAGISTVTDCVSAAVAGTAEKRPVTMRITPVGFN
jgi:hypothetical protein